LRLRRSHQGDRCRQHRKDQSESKCDGHERAPGRHVMEAGEEPDRTITREQGGSQDPSSPPRMTTLTSPQVRECTPDHTRRSVQPYIRRAVSVRCAYSRTSALDSFR
jgi:hypothetical protein